MRNEAVMVPAIRHRQLKAWASGEGLKITELVERMVVVALTTGIIPDATPGFHIIVKAKSIALVVLGFAVPTVRPQQVRTLAELFAHFGSGGKGSTRTVALAEGLFLRISRKGTGIVVRIDEPGAPHAVRTSLTPGIALDIARQLQAAADKATR